jgi:uncharacterized Zn-binding protein involved in type VI secretion
MVLVHRQDDSRVCGATTVVTGQNFVFVDGKLWAVEGDPNTDGGGGMIPSNIAAVYINGKRAIGKGDHANPDALCEKIGPPHCDPFATGGDSNVTAS